MELLKAARAGSTTLLDHLMSLEPPPGRIDLEKAAEGALEAKQWEALEFIAGHLAAMGALAESGPTLGSLMQGRLSAEFSLIPNSKASRELTGEGPEVTLADLMRPSSLVQVSAQHGHGSESKPFLIVGRENTPLDGLEVRVEDRDHLLSELSEALSSRLSAKEDQAWAEDIAVKGLGPAGAREYRGEVLRAYPLEIFHNF